MWFKSNLSAYASRKSFYVHACRVSQNRGRLSIAYARRSVLRHTLVSSCFRRSSGGSGGGLRDAGGLVFADWTPLKFYPMGSFTCLTSLELFYLVSFWPICSQNKDVNVQWHNKLYELQELFMYSIYSSLVIFISLSPSRRFDYLSVLVEVSGKPKSLLTDPCQSGTVDFWAVGTNCCDKATRLLHVSLGIIGNAETPNELVQSQQLNVRNTIWLFLQSCCNIGLFWDLFQE